LGARNLPSEGKWFHAVVSKQLGLPALISVIDANLAAVAEARAAAKAALHRQPIATEPGQAETDEPKEGTRSKRVLIAENHELLSEILRDALAARGYRVEVVSDGLQAVHRLYTGNYDLGLLDYRMPQISGLAVARLLRDFFPDDKCPRLIAFTAATDELNSKNLPSDGKWFHAVVSKQDGLPALISVIDRELSRAGQGLGQSTLRPMM
jgi:CheY-like chemotaxis protein